MLLVVLLAPGFPLEAPRAHAAGVFIRGDADGDGRLDISDPRFTLDFLFSGGETPECLAAADANDDEVLDISDPLAVLGFLFLGAEPLPLPGPAAGPDPTPGIGCGIAPPPGNRPPSISILSPAQGAVIDAAAVELRGRASDDGRVARVLVQGVDTSPPPPPVGPHTFVSTVGLRPGPNLVRVEAVDEWGRTSFRELALGRPPLLPAGASSDGLALDLSATGFDEVEEILQPLLAGVAPLIDQAVRGVLLFEGDVLGVDIRVTGSRAEVTGAVGLDLFPSDQGGGRLGMVASFERVTLFADGRSDFGFLGTDRWNATWVGRDVTIRTTIAMSPAAGGASLHITSDGFVAGIGSSDLTVSDFLDPFGIFDGLVNFLADLFRAEIEAQVRSAVEKIAGEELIPILEAAFSGLKLDLDLGLLSMSTVFRDAVESGRGLSVQLAGAWRGLDRDPAFPRYPGSRAVLAPYPAFPLTASAPHPIDATISLSADTLNQALAELTAGGFLAAHMGLAAAGAPIVLEVGTLAAVLDPGLTQLPGVSASNPLGVRVHAELPAEVILGEGALGRPIVGEGLIWRFRKGDSEPPAAWKDPGFDDSSWARGSSGFGYSNDPAELRSVRTLLEDMASMAYTSVYARAVVDLPDPASLGPLFLRMTHDDSFVAYLNGREIARANVTGAPPLHGAFADTAIEPTTIDVDLAPHRSLLRRGDNVLAVQAHNAGPSSSDFVLTPRVIERVPLPAGTLSSVPVTIEVSDLIVTFQADSKEDGVGSDDADGVADEVDLFAYRLAFRLQAALLLRRGDDGRAEVAFTIDARDGPDADVFPDAIVGGAAGLEIGVAREAVDIEDARLLEFARLILGAFAPSLGETLAGFAFPSFPLPELAFDLDGNGDPDLRLDVARATLALAETGGGPDADWICILTDLAPGS